MGYSTTCPLCEQEFEGRTLSDCHDWLLTHSKCVGMETLP